jgi:hypothetical protein
MKNKSTLAAFLLFVLINFIACTSEPVDSSLLSKNNTTTTTAAPASFKVDFNGQTYVATSTLAYVTPNQIRVVGLRGFLGENFGFILNGSTVGNYPGSTNILAYQPNNSSQYGYVSSNIGTPNQNPIGSVTITSINTLDKTISGTFSFIGYWSDSSVTNILPIPFTNGVFTNLPYSTVSPSNDTFYAKVDGNEFVDTTINVVSVNNIIGIGATNANGDVITVGITDNLTAGSYTITGNVATDVVQGNIKINPNTTATQATAGTVTILSKTATRISGTFSFTAQPNQITDGAFDVEY